MPNRLAHETSPYLLQHADNPVDWWPWSDEAFEEARRRGVPVLLSVGYSSCHWCHVMAHESFEDEATADVPERALRQRQGRPRGAARRRRRLHGGRAGRHRAGRLAHDRLPHRRTPSPSTSAPTSRPSPGTACPPSGRCSKGVAARLDRAGATRSARSPGRSSGTWPGGSSRYGGGRGARRGGAGAGAARADPGVRRRARRVRRGAEVPAVHGAGVPAAPPRPHRVRGRAADGRGHLRGDGPRRDLRPARRRVRAVLRGPRVGRAALREDALRQRAAVPGVRAPVAGHRLGAGPPGRPGDRRLHGARAAHRPRAGSPPRSTPTATTATGQARRGRLLRLDARSSCARCSATRTAELAAELLRGDRGGHLRGGRLRPPTPAGRACRRRADRLDHGSGCSPRGSGGPRPAGTTRSSPPGTGSRSPRSPRPAPTSTGPTWSSAATEAADLLVRLHMDERARLARTSKDGQVGANAGVLEDYADVAEGFLALAARDRRGGVAGVRRVPAGHRPRPVRRRGRGAVRHRARRRAADPPPAGPDRQRRPRPAGRPPPARCCRTPRTPARRPIAPPPRARWAW